MRIVIAPDAFKECLPAWRVSAAIAAGVRRVALDAEILEIPMADGGPGTLDCLLHATGGDAHNVNVTGPLGEPILAQFGILGDGVTGVVEMASAAGLELVPPDKRNPEKTTTFGVGELVLAAIDAGAKKVLVAIGGSATNDAGAGLAQALGIRLLDGSDHSIGHGGGSLSRLARIDTTCRDQRLNDVTLDVACDVTNPLVGPNGASAIYGPQKGADDAMVERLDQNLARFAEIVRRDVGISIADLPGAGAAGGLGGGLVAFAGASLRRGVEVVIDAVDLPGKLKGADLCLTGEGSFDHQSQFGKTAIGVAGVCKRLGVPAVVLAGKVHPSARVTLDLGVSAYFSIARGPSDLAEAMRHAETALSETAEQIMRLFLSASCV